MKRLVGALLILLISFPLIGAAFADFDSNIPACCRKTGKHACELARHRHGGTGPQLAADRCGQFPGSRAVPAAAKLTGVTLATRAYHVLLASQPARQAQTQALSHISYSHAGQKRGPPSFLA